MRIVWLDTDESPWLEGDGWGFLQSLGIEVVRSGDAEKIRSQLEGQGFQALVCRAEVAGAVDFHDELKKHPLLKGIPTILISSGWKKADFRKHSKRAHPADRYAQLPLPADGFAEVLCELLGTNVNELRAKASAQAAAAEGGSVLDQLFQQGQAQPAAKEAAPAEAAAPEVPDVQAEAPALAAEPQLVPEQPAISQVAANLDSLYAAGNEANEETHALRKYLQMREQELAQAQEEREEFQKENSRLTEESGSRQAQIEALAGENSELKSRLEQMEERISGAERDRVQERETLEFELKAAQERQRQLDQLLAESGEKYEGLKQRVRKDIHQIRIREKELEAKLELVRKDSETLIHARDDQVIELQKQINALECDIDQIQDSRVQAEASAERYLTKLSRVARALHLALRLVEEENPNLSASADASFEELLRDIGGDVSESSVAGGGGGTNEGGAPVNAEAATRVFDSNDLAAQAAMAAAGVAAEGSAAAALAASVPAAPAAAPAEEKPVDLAALANDGEATRIVSLDELQAAESGSGKEQAG